VTGFVAGFRIGLPLPGSKPCSTCNEPSSGMYVDAGSSSFSLPCSTNCMAATEVTGLVMDAMTNRESALTSTPDLESRLPTAPE
jgi:hypothetical protein